MSSLPKRGIVFLGLNPLARDEARALAHANADRGGVFAILDAPEPGLLQHELGAWDLKLPSGIDVFLQALALDPARTAGLRELLGSLHDDIRDELGSLILVYHEAEEGLRSMDRVVLSGHSVGHVLWGDDNGILEFEVLVELARLFPLAAAQVEDLLLSACYTGSEAKMNLFFEMFPNLKSLWAYAGSSPGTWSGAIPHLQLWEKASEGSDPSGVRRGIAKGTRKGENVATWNIETGFEGQQQLSVDEVLQALASREALFQDYFTGRASVTDPQRGPLREYYNLLQAALGSPDLDPGDRLHWEKRRDQAIRLLFYTPIRARFWAAHHGALAEEYARLGLQLPDYARLSRDQALAWIAAFQARSPASTRAAELLVQGLGELRADSSPRTGSEGQPGHALAVQPLDASLQMAPSRV